MFCLAMLLLLADAPALEMNRQGVAAFDAGRFSEAERLFRTALGESRLPAIETNLGEALMRLGRYDKAEPHLKHAGPRHRADLALLRGDARTAERLFREAIREEASVEARAGLGSALAAEGRYGEALALVKELTGDDARPAVRASALNTVGIALEGQGRYREAEAAYRKSLEIRKKRPGHPDMATGEYNLGMILLLQGRDAEAEPLLRRALAHREKLLPAGHPQIAESLNGMGLLYRTQGRNGLAEGCWRDALGILERVFGPESTVVASMVNNLAGAKFDQGRYDEAERLLLRSLAIREKAGARAAAAETRADLARLAEARGGKRGLDNSYRVGYTH